MPQIIPLTSDTPRLRQPVSRSPLARPHANTLPTQAAQIPMALQHHERRVATRSAHTLEANIPQNTTNHPAHQRHAAFTPACFALPSGTAPRKRRAIPNGTATSRTSCRHPVCPNTRSKHVTRYHKSSRSPATRRVYASLFRAPHWHGATQTHFPPRLRKSQWHCDITNVGRRTVCPHTRSSHASVSYETSSKSHASRGCKTTVSYETSSKSHTSSLQNERFVRDFLQNSHVKVCKTSVSYETSSKSQAETPIGAHTSRRPAKQFRDSSPSKQHPLTCQFQCDSDIHLHHNSQPHDSLRLPRIFPRPHI